MTSLVTDLKHISKIIIIRKNQIFNLILVNTIKSAIRRIWQNKVVYSSVYSYKLAMCVCMHFICFENLAENILTHIIRNNILITNCYAPK